MRSIISLGSSFFSFKAFLENSIPEYTDNVHQSEAGNACPYPKLSTSFSLNTIPSRQFNHWEDPSMDDQEHVQPLLTA